MRSILRILLCLLLSAPAGVLAADLEAARAAYDEALAGVDKTYKEGMQRLVQKYERTLDSLRLRLRSVSDKRTLELEKTRFAETKTVPKSPPDYYPRPLRDACTAYYEALDRLKTRRNRELKPVARSYQRGLMRLQRSLKTGGDADTLEKANAELNDLRPLLYQLDLLRGATAIRLWNQHNAKFNDRGTRTCHVRLSLGPDTVWSKDNIAMEWEADRDIATTVVPPDDVLFDRVNVRITAWEGNGGGLAEIEVLKDGKNIARGAPAKASRSAKYTPPRAVTDGNRSSKTVARGYWCLPDKTPGWIEVDLSAAIAKSLSPLQKAMMERRARERDDAAAGGGATGPSALQAMRKPGGDQEDEADSDELLLVIWNNGHPQRGVQQCNVLVYNRTRLVWSREGVTLPWTLYAGAPVTIPIPPELTFTCIRINITAWRELGGGLSELQLMKNGKNLALNRRVKVSDSGKGGNAGDLTDGDTITNNLDVGWILPDRTPGWVELYVNHRGSLRARSRAGSRPDTQDAEAPGDEPDDAKHGGRRNNLLDMIER